MRLLYCCFFDVHIDIGATLNLLQCLCVFFKNVESYRLTVLRHRTTGNAAYVAFVTII